VRRVHIAALALVALATTVGLGTVEAQPTGPTAEAEPQRTSPGPLAIHLSCRGVASFVEAETGSAWASNNRGGSASAFGYETHRGTADEDAFIEVTDGAGKMKLPGIMIPPIHSGDSQGWRSISNLEVGDLEITGTVSLNFANKLKVSINRATGHIDIRGLGRTGFSGDCRPYDPASRMF